MRPDLQHNFLCLQTVGLIALIWFAMTISFPVAAQMVPATSAETTTIQVPDSLTREEVRDLVARMSDDQVRELIISQLDKLAVEQVQASDPAVYIKQLGEGMQVAWGAISGVLTSGNKVSALLGSIWRQITRDGEISGWYLLFQLIGMLIVGWIAERLVRNQLGKNTSPQEAEATSGMRFDLTCYGMIMGVLELGAFAAGALLFLEITGQQTDAALMLWYQVVWCLVLIRFFLLMVRQIVASDRSITRLVSVPDAVLKQILVWTVILATFLVLPLPMIEVANDFGADAETDLLLRIILFAPFVFLLILLSIRLRHYGADLIMGTEPNIGRIRQGLARIWWALTIVYVLVIWFMAVGKLAATGQSSLVPGLGSLLLFVLIPYLDMGLQKLITRYFEYKEEDYSSDGLPSGEGSSETSADTTNPVAPDVSVGVELLAEDITTGVRAYEPDYIATALRYARVLMALALLMIFVRLWGIDIRAISAQLVGQHFSSALFDISITILLAWALWGVIRISIERKLDDGKGVVDDEEESDAGGLGGTRVETVLPLMRVFIKITLIVMVVLISLSALGVNIGPLIAGAGVVGIAIGFGAQTLVRDIFSGFFYLIDDAFRIGEYVVIDQIRGTVEKISVRSFQLRHHNGPVHTIPYGEIRSVTNWSRDWAIMKFELRIPFETDIDMVRKTIKRIGLDMMEDPVFGPLMLQPVKSQGVNRMDDSALIIRCKFTAIPGQQYLIRREAFTRIQKVFEEKGIHFAPRRVLVEATSPQEAIKGAAAVLDQEIEGESAPKNNQSDL